MTKEIGALIITAASIGFFHTLLGPDHYLPFIMMSWARKWSNFKTSIITVLCGLGHVASSVVLGFLGVSIGIVVQKLEFVESFRGNVAAWLLIGFGFAYCIWGIRRAYKGKPHIHTHAHMNGHTHEHLHEHQVEHSHIHEHEVKTGITPWALFLIFVFGPCEPLIPILMYPAAKSSWPGLLLVTLVFSVTTIGTMLIVVMIAKTGVNLAKLSKLQRYSHVIAGAAILICGLAIQILGL
ncbi:MAG: urease accessory protein UreH domain-containing protein [Planctomycetota bacterium]|jgi:ABC-type nickel/cobalt efflux system permease component RcnA